MWISKVLLPGLLIAVPILEGKSPLKESQNWFYFADENGVAVAGYDVVAYFQEGKATLGSGRYQVSHEGLTYRFANSENQKKFNKNPKAWLPQYGGWCAYGCALDRSKPGLVPSRYVPDPTSFKIVDGKLYLFARYFNFQGLQTWNQGDERVLLKRSAGWWQTRLELAKRWGLPTGMNPRAPMETAQFGFLVGTWDNKVKWMQDPQKRNYGPEIGGIWSAEFAWDGFALNDNWRQVGRPGSGGPGWRTFDPNSGKWTMVYIPINGPKSAVWVMEGRFDENGELHGNLEGVDWRGQPFLQKIHFYHIKQNSFTWRADRSYDGGKSWIEAFSIATNQRRQDNGPGASQSTHN